MVRATVIGPGDREAVEERHPESKLSEQGNADGQSREEDRSTRRVDGVDRGVFDAPPARSPLRCRVMMNSA